jgi:hypothetical protein
MTKKIIVVGTANDRSTRIIAAHLISDVKVIAMDKLNQREQDTWGIIVPPKPLGNERKGKRKTGKSRYEPPKFG